MAEYIEREAAIKAIYESDPNGIRRTFGFNVGQIEEALRAIPAADVVPVRHGLWIPVHASEATGWDPKIAGSDPIWGYICTNCRNEAIFDCNDEYILSDYCPNCGAKMDGQRAEGEEND